MGCGGSKNKDKQPKKRKESVKGAAPESLEKSRTREMQESGAPQDDVFIDSEKYCSSTLIEEEGKQSYGTEDGDFAIVERPITLK